MKIKLLKNKLIILHQIMKISLILKKKIMSSEYKNNKIKSIYKKSKKVKKRIYWIKFLKREFKKFILILTL
jgi:hypothetical protein